MNDVYTDNIFLCIYISNSETLSIRTGQYHFGSNVVNCFSFINPKLKTSLTFNADGQN